MNPLRTLGLGALAAGLLWAAPATAQYGPVPPPPGAPAPATAARPPPAEPEPIMPPLGNARLRLSLGGLGLVLDRDEARGFEQLENVGLSKPKVALRANLEIRWRLGEILRLGVAGGLDWTRQADDGDDLPIGDEVRTSAIRTGYVEGVLMLGVTHEGTPTNVTDIGLRLTGGGGVASWVWNGEPELTGLYRVSGAFDVSFLFGHETAHGIGFRLGWAHARTGELGPLGLRFDLSGPFFDIGYVHGW